MSHWMLRLVGSVAALIAGGAGIYWLMVWDTHFLLLAVFGTACGGLAGGIFWGRRGWILGAILGFVVPLAYIPVWLIFNLPPDTGIDL